jgi:hypothetical protein
VHTGKHLGHHVQESAARLWPTITCFCMSENYCFVPKYLYTGLAMWGFFFHSSRQRPESMRVTTPATAGLSFATNPTALYWAVFPIFYNYKKLKIFYSKHFKIMSRQWVLPLNTYLPPVVLYGCETWSLILREEQRLRVFDNRVLRRIFGPKRDETTRRGKTT